jgi:hypothetical protein
MSGCDPVRTITHNVTVAVVDEKGLPAPDVNVSMKESWESWQSWGRGVEEADKAYYRQQWASDFVPWLKGVTNAQGNAVIKITITALDRTRGNEPPAKRDTVSNREYIIKLQRQNVQDELRLVMEPGASVKGKSYTVTVIDIQKPRYVPTREVTAFQFQESLMVAKLVDFGNTYDDSIRVTNHSRQRHDRILLSIQKVSAPNAVRHRGYHPHRQYTKTNISHHTPLERLLC